MRGGALSWPGYWKWANTHLLDVKGGRLGCEVLSLAISVSLSVLAQLSNPEAPPGIHNCIPQGYTHEGYKMPLLK